MNVEHKLNTILNKLTIAIPTFNRANELDQLLESISAIFGKVNVVISDNASEDNTYLIVKKYISGSKLDIDYVRSEKNMGADFNYFQAIDLVKTDYCMLFGSDDKFEPDALATIVRMMDIGYDVSVFRRRVYDSNLSKFKYEESFYYKDNISVDLNDKNSYIFFFDNCKSLGGVFSYISSILFKKSFWSDSLSTRKYFGTAYSHSAALFEGMVKNGNAFLHLSSKAIIACRSGNDSFSSLGVLKRYLIDWDGYEGIARQYFSICDQSMCDILSRQMTFRQCLALAYGLKKSNHINEIQIVDSRMQESVWGRKVFLRWTIAKYIPIKLIDLVIKR